MRPATQLQAFEHAYRHEGPYVAAVLGRLSVPSEAVHDALQDVFVAAYRRWDDFDDSRPVRPWLTGFARRVAFRYRRSAARRYRKRAALHVNPRPEPIEPARRVVAQDFLDRFLDSLPQGHREVFVRADLQGKTAKEIAQELSIGVEAVYGRIRSTRKRLKLALLEDAHQPSSQAASLVPPWGLMLTRLGETALTPIAATGGLVPMGFKMVAAACVAVAVGFGATPSSAQSPSEVIETPSHNHASRAVSIVRRPSAFVAKPVVEVAPHEEAAVEVPQAKRVRRRNKHVSPDDSLRRETTLLRRARAQHRQGELKAALRSLQAHAREFPSGQLADGRRRARIRVLCDLGRKEQAHREAQKLVQDRPGDPLALQSLSICVPG